mgnify:CR=1 FL=1
MLFRSFIAAKYSLEQNLGWAQITLPIIIGAIAASILNGASNSINQIYDYEIDKINKPSRLLPSKQITFKEAWLITIITYFISLGLAFYIGFGCFLIFLAAAIFTIFYSVPPIRTKRHWLTAAFTIAIPRGTLLKVAGWAVLMPVNHFEPWYVGDRKSVV